MKASILTHIIIFMLLTAGGYGQVQVIDSAKKVFANLHANDSGYIPTCFFIADSYMNTEHYDSAQVWLNKIHEKLPAKKASLFNYFLITRQAEVYYYNNLLQLGLQESFKGLETARALGDSLLLADSYNFLGLFYMNLDSSREGVEFYRKGLQYARQPPYPSNYFSLSKPHHLYSNMAMAFYRIKMYDSALVNIRLSLQKAYQINWERGIAVGHKGAGDIFLALHQSDSALLHYQKGKFAAKRSKDIDVELVCYGGYANSLDATGAYGESKLQLDTAFEILLRYPTLNRYFAFQFLNIAADIYKKRNDYVLLARALELKSEKEMANLKSSNAQIQTILKASVENEKRLLSLEVKEAQQKKDLANTRLLIAVTALSLLAVAFLWYRYSQKQKIHFANVRHKISQDLHDDIGASLSSLQIYGAIAEKSIIENPAKAMEMVEKIARQSKLLMENMGDIVWSMQPADESNTSLAVRVKNFGAELLNDKSINFTYSVLPETESILTGMHARKNILLLIKEAMNNIAKYSQAKNATLKLEIKNKNIQLEIQDDGIGFDSTRTTGTGNGLKNMAARTKEMKGEICIISSPGKGSIIKVSIPLASINSD